MATKEAQINLRLPVELDAWVEARAGGRRAKPEFIRQLLERERSRDEELELLELFNDAWDDLPERDRHALRREREEWLGASSASPRA
jgi:hypothetical protein